MNSTQSDLVAIASIELYRHLESQAQAIPPEITLSLIKPLVSNKDCSRANWLYAKRS